MLGLFADMDGDRLLECSMVFTDRMIDHMSRLFRGAMHDLSGALKRVYDATSVGIAPGSVTFGMEAVARQFAMDKKCMVTRNGWFSFRWSQIFDVARIPSESIVAKVHPVEQCTRAAYAPPLIENVVAAISNSKPDLVFSPYVETDPGFLLLDDCAPWQMPLILSMVCSCGIASPPAQFGSTCRQAETMF
jgi:aspartate aminotransferase-like enzyme